MISGVVPVEPADPPAAADESADLLRHHWRVLEMLSSGQPLADILETIISSLEQLVPGIRCSILLVDGTRRVLRHGAAPSLPEDYVRAIGGIPVGPAVGSCGTAAYTNRPVITVDVQTDPRWERFRDEAAAAGLRSCARARKGCVYLTVGDDGPGIPAEILPRLFAPFEHYGTAACDASGCEAADSRSGLEGFGLGLALARGLAVATGGDLRADNPARGGTLMTVILTRAVT